MIMKLKKWPGHMGAVEPVKKKNIVNSKSQQVEDCLDQVSHAVNQPSRYISDNSEVI
jgi:hypothetical protein